MKRTIWIFGDQLCRNHPGLRAGSRSDDWVLMIETRELGQPTRFHQQKLVLAFSAMRHFADELRADGWRVEYRPLEDSVDETRALREHIERFHPDEIVAMELNNFHDSRRISQLCEDAGIRLNVLPSIQFLVSRDDFAHWASSKDRLLMESHYRRLRREFDILMADDDTPEGGAWNFDPDNRRSLKDWKNDAPGTPAEHPVFASDATTTRVIDTVAKHFAGYPGDARQFSYAVTRQDAREALRRFVAERLTYFGDWQDLMLTGMPRMFHSVISPYLNIGLLLPMECVNAAVQAYRDGHAPIAAVEGFVRQIVGWREFVNGVYWLRMPKYSEVNALDAHRPLPGFFYSGTTDLHCLHTTLSEVIDSAYNHHIQRLMILGNFLLLTGVRPDEALRWFTEMYIDAWDWVMAANVLGMALHADGGFMATKPYAASAGYISKMSNYCKSCRFSPSIKSGEGACPFNLLYWAFYDRHQDRFARNPRTAVMVKSWNKRPAAERRVILREASEFLDRYVAQQ